MAYLLSQQGQDVRQEAATPSDYPPKQFTLQHLNAEVETFEASNAPDYAPSSVNLKIDFVPSAPNCGTTMSCTADVRATLVDDAGAPALPENCTINTASLVYYRFLTDTTSTYYPDNLTYNNFDPGGWGNANCNRPVSQCAADPNCDTKVINPIYGPPSSQCGPEGCLYFQTQTEFSITNTEYGCGCIQFDVNISNMSLNCTSRDGQSTTVSYRRTSNNGPWAYGYNTDRCEEPVPTATVTPTPQATNTPTPTPTTPASATATPTPTSPPNATATPTATPAPFGEMCLDITANPAAPKYNDAVTFTCAAVAGVESYQFRYFEPSTLTPTALATREKNVSQPLTVNKAGEYTVQCRICPPATATNQYCNDPNWGWDPIVTTQVRE